MRNPKLHVNVHLLDFARDMEFKKVLIITNYVRIILVILPSGRRVAAPGQNPNDCKKNNDDKFIQQEEPAQEEPAQEMPSKIQMAKNFAKSAVNHVSNGMKKVDVDLQTQRLEICAACPFISADKSRCTKCGCFLAAKTKWESSSCPINKW